MPNEQELNSCLANIHSFPSPPGGEVFVHTSLIWGLAMQFALVNEIGMDIIQAEALNVHVRSGLVSCIFVILQRSACLR